MPLPFDGRWLVVAAVPVCSYVVGFVALPRPTGTAAEERALDRAKLGTAVSTTATNPNSKVDVQLGGVLALRGADLPQAALSRGAKLPIALHFGVDDALEEDWQVFLHIDLQGQNGAGYRIHGDHWPVRGQYKTSFWKKGEFVVDSWEGTVPLAAPAGVYDVWTGLYRGDERLPVTRAQPTKVTDGEDRVKVGQIVIE